MQNDNNFYSVRNNVPRR